MGQVIKTRADGDLLRITLARPEKKNALDLDTLQRLAEAIEGCKARVILLDAEGDVFCGGGDIEVMRDFAGNRDATVERLRSGLNRVVKALRDAPPVVCAVQGNAYGAGAILAFQCDLTVASEEAAFALSFRHVGLIPDTGATWLLPRRLGLQRAKHLVWTGASFTAAEAAAWGLILRSVPKAQVKTQAEQLAKGLADGPLATMRLAKSALQDNAEAPLDDALEREALTQGEAFTTAEHAEGRDAFFARRRPDFKR